jgi:glycosyltransferase involved in cell wall biosynthesis
MTDKISVSCLMPTHARAHLLPRAVRNFLAQGLLSAELIIISEDDLPEFLSRISVSVRHLTCPEGLTLGAKRNLACEAARGEILVHWDDDDLYAPDRLIRQVAVLKAGNSQLTGSSRIHFLEESSRKCWEYRYGDRQRPWVYGATLAYKRAYWKRNPFANVTVGEDNIFVWAATAGEVHDMDDPGLCLCIIHDRNTSRKKTDDEWWHPIELPRKWPGLLSSWEADLLSYNANKSKRS